MMHKALDHSAVTNRQQTDMSKFMAHSQLFCEVLPVSRKPKTTLHSIVTNKCSIISIQAISIMDCSFKIRTAVF